MVTKVQVFGAVSALLLALALPSTSHGAASLEVMSHAMNLKFADMKWARMFPNYAERSPEITILRVDSVSHATQLMIRIPKNFHVTRHWHSSNETHTVVSGTLVME